MSEETHGHEVMRMMVSSGKTYTEDSLEKSISERFGTDARFHTCSAKGMTAKELIGFFKAKGKFTGSDAGFSTAPDRICDH